MTEKEIEAESSKESTYWVEAGSGDLGKGTSTLPLVFFVENANLTCWFVLQYSLKY